MSHVLRVGVADQIAYFRAYNTDGSAKTDLSSATTGLALSVFRIGSSSVSISSLSDKAADNSTHADGAIRAVSGNLYTVDLPDASCVNQVPSIVVRGSYTGGVIEGLEHPVVAYDPSAVAVGANTTTPPTVGEIADSVWDEPYAQHTTAGSFGKLLDTIRKSNLTIDGTVSNAITPTTLTFSSNVSATTSAYAHAVLLFTTGPLAGENSPIISYTSTNGVFVLEEALTAAPSNGDEFVVLAGSHVHAVTDIRDGLAPAINAATLSPSDGRPSTMAKDSTLRWTIYVRDRSTGSLADADSTPTVTVRKNGASSAETVTVTKRSATTGIYDCSFNPTGEADGDSYELAEAVVLGSTTYRTTFSVSVQPTLAVVFDPLVSVARKRLTNTTITLYANEEIDISLSVFDSDGDPVDLNGKDLIVVIEDTNGDDLASITSITVSGNDNNTVTFTVPAAVTASTTTIATPRHWSLRDKLDGDRVLGVGNVVVKYAAYQD